jgi:hypothetical protein
MCILLVLKYTVQKTKNVQGISQPFILTPNKNNLHFIVLLSHYFPTCSSSYLSHLSYCGTS